MIETRMLLTRNKTWAKKEIKNEFVFRNKIKNELKSVLFNLESNLDVSIRTSRFVMRKF